MRRPEQTAPASAADEAGPNAAQSSRAAEIGALRRRIERYRAALDEWAARRDESPEMDRRGKVEQLRLSEAISRNEARLAELEGGAPAKSPAVRYSSVGSAGAVALDALPAGTSQETRDGIARVMERAHARRPYLMAQKRDEAQVTGGASVRPGNARSLPSAKEAAGAVLSSLDELSVANRPAEVKTALEAGLSPNFFRRHSAAR